MLRLHADQVDSLWDALLPDALRLLPDALHQLDGLLADARLLDRFKADWDRRAAAEHGPHPGFGRPTIAMASYLRLMLIKQRMGWGYETLMREVADSLHLRRFCLIPLAAAIPHESTVRKLTRRLAADVVDELTREIISLAVRERHFRPRALRCDSTVMEADIRYPTDAGLTADAVRTLAKAARTVEALVPRAGQHVRDRSRAVNKRLRALGRTLRRRTGEARAAVETLTKEAAVQLKRSLGEAKRLLARASCSRSKAAGQPAGMRALARLQAVISLAERVVSQVQQRFAGQPIHDRLVSLFDADARPVRRGKLGKPNEFGYVVQLAEVTANTRRGARGLLLPPKLVAGSAHDNSLLPQTGDELVDLKLTLKEAAFDAGFAAQPTTTVMAQVGAEVFIAGYQQRSRSARTRRRLARYRVGAEGRISHLKRGYGARRARLKGQPGARIWMGWAVLAYNLDTVVRMNRHR